MKKLLQIITSIILCFLYSYSFSQNEKSLLSNIEYFCKKCDYKLFTDNKFKQTVKDSKSNSFEFYVYEKNSTYFCTIKNSQRKAESTFELEGQWMEDIGYAKINEESSDILIITGIGGSGGAGKVINLINLENMAFINFSYIQMGQELPEVTRSKNFSSLKAESEYIEKLKFDYGYIDGEYLENNTNNPNVMMEVWRYYNNEVNYGKTRIFTYTEIPEYFNNTDEHPKLETDEMVFTAYHKSGVIAYNKIDKTYSVIFVPKGSYSWVQVIEKYKNYILLGTRLEGLAILNLNSYTLKRIDFGEKNNDIKKISVRNNRILLNDKREIDFEEFQ